MPQIPAVDDFEDMLAGIDKKTLAVDFALPTGVTLTGTPELDITVYSGTDSDPDSRIISGPTVGTAELPDGTTSNTDCAILAQLGNLQAGATYLLVWSCNRTDGDVAACFNHVTGVQPPTAS